MAKKLAVLTGGTTLAGYQCNASLGALAQYAAAPLPNALAGGLAYFNGVAIWGGNVAPRLMAAPFSWNSGFSALFANPPSFPTTSRDGITIIPTGQNDCIVVSGGAGAGVTAIQRLCAWPLNVSAGWGAEFAAASLDVSVTRVHATALSPNGGALVYRSDTAQSLRAVEWNNVTGFGAEYAPPVGNVNSAGNVVFSPDGFVVAPCASNAPVLSHAAICPWDDVTGFGALDSLNFPRIGSGESAAFSPGGGALAIAGDYVDALFPLNVYVWDSGNVVSEYPAPVDVPACTVGYQVTFSTDGKFIMLASNAAAPDTIAAWRWDDSTGFGERVTFPSPASAIAGAGSPVLIVDGPSDITPRGFSDSRFLGVKNSRWPVGRPFDSKHLKE